MATLAAAPLGAQTPEISVERRLARESGVVVGDTVALSDQDGQSRMATVAAIHVATDDPATLMRRDLAIRMHLGDLAELVGQPDRVDRVGVRLQPGVQMGDALDRISRVAYGYVPLATDSVSSASSATFLVVSRFHRAIAAISVVASSIFLLSLMLLKVEERRGDVAVMRLIGISRGTVASVLILEATLLALLGSIAGALLGALSSTAVNSFYMRAFETELLFSMLTAGTLLPALALALLLGIAAGTAAALRLIWQQPLELWRRGR